MERLEFLELCKAVSMLKKGIQGIRNTPPTLWVEYEGIKFYPIGYKLTYEKGIPKHTAIVHDLNANSVLECDLSKVQRVVNNEQT